MHPHDPDAKITKMKDGRTHLAHNAEHAIDLETGAIVGVTVQSAAEGDTTTIQATPPPSAAASGAGCRRTSHELARLVGSVPEQHRERWLQELVDGLAQ
jgi:hypothetical protein